MFAWYSAESINEVIILFVLSYYRWTNIEILSRENWEIWLCFHFFQTLGMYNKS